VKRTLCPKYFEKNNRTKTNYKRNPIKNHSERKRIDEESIIMMKEYEGESYVSYGRYHQRLSTV
jgi:hypothetical protein